MCDGRYYLANTTSCGKFARFPFDPLQNHRRPFKRGAPERWPSGLRRTLGKRVCGKPYRGFESHSLRQSLFRTCSPCQSKYQLAADLPSFLALNRTQPIRFAPKACSIAQLSPNLCTFRAGNGRKNLSKIKAFQSSEKQKNSPRTWLPRLPKNLVVHLGFIQRAFWNRYDSALHGLREAKKV